MSAVAGAPPLPDYRDTLEERLSAPLAQLNEAGQYRDAIKLADACRAVVGWRQSPTAGAHNQLGEFDVALRHSMPR